MAVRHGRKPRILALRWEAYCPAGCEPDSVVWIDVRALDASWAPSSERVGPGGTGAAIEGRYEKFGTWLHASRVAVHMPFVGFDGEGPDAPVVFTDGRHRFAWLRDRGLRRMPVAAAPSGAGRLAGRFGVREAPSLVLFPASGRAWALTLAL